MNNKVKEAYSFHGRGPGKATVAVMGGIRLVVFDFDGVFTDNNVWVDEEGRETIRCCRSDGFGLQRLRQAGIDTLILSAEPNPVVLRRAAKLKLRCINGAEDKLAVLKKEIKRLGFNLKEVAYVGNDINDAECLNAVGLPVVVADAWHEVKRLAKWILKRRGGEGAVREFCDEVVKCRMRKSNGCSL